MALQVLGSGMGRTGTLSLKLALEEIGFGKCYHMYELFQHPEGLKYFQAAEKGDTVDWDSLFEGYHSAVDYPACRYYKTLMQKYPDAKIVHTIRDAESWYKSISSTIFWATKPSLGRILSMMIRMPFSKSLRQRLPILKYNGGLVDMEFGKDLKDKEKIIGIYNEYNAGVIKSLPKEKLLVFDVKSGWEPLCAFLNVPVPVTPFPKSNSTDEFVGRVKKITSADLPQ